MAHVVQLGADNTQPFPLLVTTTRRQKNDNETPLVECFQVEEMAWTHPMGAALRADQQAEFDMRYGEPGKEPGIKPSAEDVALFVVAYPIKRMYAVPNARGTGAALSVLTSLEHYARGLGAHGLRLETGSMQDDAKRFYQKHGYEEIPLFGDYKEARFSNCYQKLCSAE
ncbi:unnamed protein product [Rhizoctonia solani]|uniref:N-acetyltransferase domain-containing protein n=1 Tax=Rhizoctonia solani TaxID=456999 RepID=A0A8H3GNK9_9AGAM|nr:unnamed protein product [Rhizoctonia solani]